MIVVRDTSPRYPRDMGAGLTRFLTRNLQFDDETITNIDVMTASFLIFFSHGNQRLSKQIVPCCFSPVSWIALTNRSDGRLGRLTTYTNPLHLKTYSGNLRGSRNPLIQVLSPSSLATRHSHRPSERDIQCAANAFRDRPTRTTIIRRCYSYTA